MDIKKNKHEQLNAKEENSSLHHVFSWAIFVMQIFGFMPIQGVFKNHPADIYFTWKSIRTFYACLTTFGLFFMTANQMARFFIFRVQMADIQRLWYFLKSLFVSLFFMSLAKNWKHFLNTWNNTDTAMLIHGKPKYVTRTVRRLLIFFLCLLAGDYCLVQVQRIEEDLVEGDVTLNMETWNHFQKDLRFGYVYTIFPYDFVSGICLLFVQIQVIFAGTFLDLFIMIISLSLAARMEVVTKRIQQVSKCKNVPEHVWIHIREDYNLLEILCNYVNSKIGCSILICFIGNLGIILIQLFNNLKVKRSFIQRSYLYYAFGFLLSKTIAVCILGSKINDESKKPLIYLYAAHNSANNIEIDRLVRQIARDNMALSGMNFFHIRRNMVLKIAGSIVTYELVLIQFAGDFLKDYQIVNRTSSL